jgi:hypothetical protein
MFRCRLTPPGTQRWTRRLMTRDAFMSALSLCCILTMAHLYILTMAHYKEAQSTCCCMLLLHVQVVFDPSWNPALDLQAQDRAYRMGQTRDVEVYRLVGTGEQYKIITADTSRSVVVQPCRWALGSSSAADARGTSTSCRCQGYKHQLQMHTLTRSTCLPNQWLLPADSCPESTLEELVYQHQVYKQQCAD